MRFRDKVVLITGAGSGLGRAASILFAREGAKIIVADIDVDRANETVNLIRKDGGEATSVKVDVTNASDAENMVKVATQKYGGVDVLFNNAGIAISSKLVDLPEEEWDRILNINLKGVFLCSKYAIPEMIKRGGGTIINTASDSGLTGDLFFSAYCASKAGVIGLTKSMAMECAMNKIRVNCICQSAMNTPMLKHEVDDRSGGDPRVADELRELFARDSLVGRIAEPDEFARIVMFLASNEASWMAGVALELGGRLSGASYYGRARFHPKYNPSF